MEQDILLPQLSFLKLMQDALEYSQDSIQKSILFTDVVRQQGTNFIDENNKGLPPVIDFDYEIIFRGTDLDRPVNYSLARITPENGADIPEDARPIVIIDPRAGHGPGIGGFKKESEVGIAMKNKHPVYFIMFSQKPEPGQTLADITRAEIEFIQIVNRFHPNAGRAAIIGNCQAGWAIALLAADRPDIAGPLILNGSPLSYWAGDSSSNPMRLKGGLAGGSWMSLMAADLSNGMFDGAHLVKNFEDLNPANTLWGKQYNLYANIDTESERFLHFEKWWNGFVFLTAEEIKFITEELFIGNKLEQGMVELGENKKVDLVNLRDPIIIFSSDGDNITPPQQALNWVFKVWGSVEEIKLRKQVVIHLRHKDIGHLGIFVSGKVIRNEHNEMIGSIDLIKLLSPGLYEMVIEKGEDGKQDIQFVAQNFRDLKLANNSVEDEKLWYVNQLSKLNEKNYHQYLKPYISTMSNEILAEFLRIIHPLRLPRYIYSDLNPSLIPAKTLSPYIKKNRIVSSDENKFKKAEKIVSESISTILDFYKEIRDSYQHLLFDSLYSNPLLKLVVSKETPEDKIKKYKPLLRTVREDEFTTGNFVEGTIRGLLALYAEKKKIEKSELIFIKDLIEGHIKVEKKDRRSINRLIAHQSEILTADKEKAIKSIPNLITSQEDRLVAAEIFELGVSKNAEKGSKERNLFEKIMKSIETAKIL